MVYDNINLPDICFWSNLWINTMVEIWSGRHGSTGLCSLQTVLLKYARKKKFEQLFKKPAKKNARESVWTWRKFFWNGTRRKIWSAKKKSKKLVVARKIAKKLKY